MAKDSSKPSQSKRLGSIWKRSGFWLAIMVAFMVITQWPMIKGMYYRASAGPAPADAIGWRTDLPAALAESQKTGKPVLVDFSASWCPPCQVMKHEVWPDARVAQAISAGYIPVLLDADSAEARQPGERYGVQVIPTILILDGQGKVVRQAHYMGVNELLKFLTGQ